MDKTIAARGKANVDPVLQTAGVLTYVEAEILARCIRSLTRSGGPSVALGLRLRDDVVGCDLPKYEPRSRLAYLVGWRKGGLHAIPIADRRGPAFCW